METIYLKTTLRARPRGEVLDLQSYREQKALLLEGTALPEPLPEITPELPEPTVRPLDRFIRWADAAASAALALGALLVLASLL